MGTLDIEKLKRIYMLSFEGKKLAHADSWKRVWLRVGAVELVLGLVLGIGLGVRLVLGLGLELGLGLRIRVRVRAVDHALFLELAMQYFWYGHLCFLVHRWEGVQVLLLR